MTFSFLSIAISCKISPIASYKSSPFSKSSALPDNIPETIKYVSNYG